MKQNEKEIKIMEDKGPWVFTEEQIKNIKNNDINAMTEFYNTNYSLLSRIAGKFVSKRRRIGDNSFCIEDLMQQVFIDLPFYNYSSRAKLYRGITRCSFLHVYNGGFKGSSKDLFISPLRTFSIYNDESDFSIADFYVENVDVLDLIDKDSLRAEKDLKIIEFLKKTIKNKKDLKLMYYKIFTDIPLRSIKEI